MLCVLSSLFAALISTNMVNKQESSTHVKKTKQSKLQELPKSLVPDDGGDNVEKGMVR